MQKVSQAYIESMKSPLRERSFMQVAIGLINQQAQAKADVTAENQSAYSNTEKLFQAQTIQYELATLETNRMRVDGRMYIPYSGADREIAYAKAVVPCLTSDELVSNEQPYTVNFQLNTEDTDIYGLTLCFGDGYPEDFTITTNTSQTLTITGNTSAVWTTEEVFEGIRSLSITFTKMKDTQRRLRLYYVLFGIGLVYTNDNLISATLESTVSPISAELPQIDFTLQLPNYDSYFNEEDPDSAIHFFETGQQVDIYYGYDLEDGVEWIPGYRLYCSGWEASSNTATIYASDIFRLMDGTYEKGIYSAAGTSFYDLAKDVLADAGITSYSIDPYLKKRKTTCPIPLVSHKEALQIIANACRAMITQSRDGKIQIQTSFTPEISEIAAIGEGSLSDVENILNNSEKNEFAIFANNYIPVNGDMYFFPTDVGQITNTGYVTSLGNASGYIYQGFKITLENSYVCNGFQIVFGYGVPSYIVVRTYLDGFAEENFSITEDITKIFDFHHPFQSFDTIEIIFSYGSSPYSIVTVNSFSFGSRALYTIDKTDILSDPVVNTSERTKRIAVPWYAYNESTEEKSVAKIESEEFIVGETLTFTFSNPTYAHRVEIDSSNNIDEIADITFAGAYSLTLTFKKYGTYTIEVFGREYNVTTSTYITRLGNSGTEIRWENPLISSYEMAKELNAWIEQFHANNMTYQYNTRGNPELDCGDIIYQQTRVLNNECIITSHTVNFTQALSGSIISKTIGGDT